MDYNNRNIAVLGLGASGQAAAELLRKEGAIVTVLDTAERTALQHRVEYLERLGVRVITGKSAASDLSPYHHAILSPGIDPTAPLVRHFIERRIDMIGELELAFELCRCPIVAITGTNGKTTTTELVATMFRNCNVRTEAAGNIGTAFSALVASGADLDVATLEVSSFQLETIRSFRPRIAAWLNFSPDHLDRYPSLDAYRAAKLRIFENQSDKDLAVINLRDQIPGLKARALRFSASLPGGDLDLRDHWIRFRSAPVLDLRETALRGLHNAENLMAALAIGVAWGLDPKHAAQGLKTYKPQPHRCELVGEWEGIAWINDSKGTNPDSVEKALASQDRPVLLIAGGKEKGFGFSSLAPQIKEKCRCAILIGETRPRMRHDWADTTALLDAASLAEAVALAKRHAQPGDVVLLSPGTSSFDMFKDYKDRGDQFRTLVKQTTEKP